MTTTFENVKVGDKVWDFNFSYGIVERTGTTQAGDNYLDVEFNGCEPITYSITGVRFGEINRTLFWDEIKFEVPEQSPRMKLIHGVEVPDISFEPKEGEHYYYPFCTIERLCNQSLFNSFNSCDEFRSKNALCYPYTEEGKQAAILHTKAMLGIKG